MAGAWASRPLAPPSFRGREPAAKADLDPTLQDGRPRRLKAPCRGSGSGQQGRQQRTKMIVPLVPTKASRRSDPKLGKKFGWAKHQPSPNSRINNDGCPIPESAGAISETS